MFFFSVEKKKKSKSKRNKELVFEEIIVDVLRDMRGDTIDIAVAKLIQIDDGGVFREENSRILVHNIIDRATHFVRFATVYVQLCQRLIDIDPNASTESAFNKLLLNACQGMFMDKIMNAPETVNPKDRHRCLGIIRFIGVLFMYNLLYANIIEGIVGALLDCATENRLEYLYELLAIVSKRIQMRSGDRERDAKCYRNLDHFYGILTNKLDEMPISSETRGRCRALLREHANDFSNPLPMILGDYGPPVKQQRKKAITVNYGADDSFGNDDFASADDGDDSQCDDHIGSIRSDEVPIYSFILWKSGNLTD